MFIAIWRHVADECGNTALTAPPLATGSASVLLPASTVTMKTAAIVAVLACVVAVAAAATEFKATPIG